jgi:hypothetical protein
MSTIDDKLFARLFTTEWNSCSGGGRLSPIGDTPSAVPVGTKFETAIGCHTFRATGITVYLMNGGTLDVGQPYCLLEQSCPGFSLSRFADYASARVSFFNEHNRRQCPSLRAAAEPRSGGSVAAGPYGFDGSNSNSLGEISTLTRGR